MPLVSLAHDTFVLDKFQSVTPYKLIYQPVKVLPCVL